MGSRRRLLFVALALLAGTASVPAAHADPADDARSTATRFADAFSSGDSKAACGLMTQAALERLGGREICEFVFRLSGAYTAQDAAAMRQLRRAHEAAQKSADKRSGQFVSKKFPARALARDMERIDRTLTVRLGNTPRAAARQLDTTVILDTRSTARRLVLYAESDDGSIWRLSAAWGMPDLEEVAQGVPEAAPEPAMAISIETVSLFSDGRALARGTMRFADDEYAATLPIALVLVAGGDGYLVDDLLISMFWAPG
jgi:hypothetical protein